MSPIRYCDRCEVKPASSRKHNAGMRLCAVCDREVVVDEHGSFITRHPSGLLCP